MAGKLLKISDYVPGMESDAARDRVERSRQLRDRVLSDQFTHAIYGPEQPRNAYADELMPTPDEVAFRNGGYEIYDQMASVCPHYASLVAGAVDVLRVLPMSVLPGEKGDLDSEEAAEDIREALQRIEDLGVAFDQMAVFIERGFSALENVFDVMETGRLKDFVTIVTMINRPLDWFGFDWANRPFHKRERNYQQRNEAVPDFKVLWGRSGSLHTRYGKGKGEPCYPAVWAINEERKKFVYDNDRNAYSPLVIKYPRRWSDAEVMTRKSMLERQWKNLILIPGDVDDLTPGELQTGAAYANANATGVGRLAVIAQLKEELSAFYQGSSYSNANQKEGSFARDQVADTARLYKAPSYASCKEAALNRGFVAPLMIINRPTLPRYKWPRVAIDASFGEDLRLFMDLFVAARKEGLRISDVTWSEHTKIPLAKEGDEVSEAPKPEPPMVAAQPPALQQPQMFTEPLIRIGRSDGTYQLVPPDFLFEVEGRSEPVRAAMLQNDDVIVGDPARFVKPS